MSLNKIISEELYDPPRHIIINSINKLKANFAYLNTHNWFIQISEDHKCVLANDLNVVLSEYDTVFNICASYLC